MAGKWDQLGAGNPASPAAALRLRHCRELRRVVMKHPSRLHRWGWGCMRACVCTMPIWHACGLGLVWGVLLLGQPHGLAVSAGGLLPASSCEQLIARDM
jgi:hypothetical protein